VPLTPPCQVMPAAGTAHIVVTSNANRVGTDVEVKVAPIPCGGLGATPDVLVKDIGSLMRAANGMEIIKFLSR